MAAFCSNCGAPLAAGARFCDKCGTAVAGQSAPPGTPTAAVASPAPYPAPVPAASQSSNTALKVIIGILGVFALLALLVAGSCFYIGYRVRQRAKEFSNEMGGSVAPYSGSRIPCEMLSAKEASSALGQPVTSFSQVGLNTCHYKFGPGGNRSLDIQFSWRGGAIAMGVARGVSQISGSQTFTAVPGVGDETYVAPEGSALMMRKGDVLVNIELQNSGVSADAAEAMAKKIASHL